MCVRFHGIRVYFDDEMIGAVIWRWVRGSWLHIELVGCYLE